MIQTLNFHDLAWPNFQKLVVSFARDVEGHREATEYGTQGQSQHGLDVLARSDAGECHAYQARNVKTFSQNDLHNAVEDFANGKRPQNPSRFVIVVACNTDRTEIVDELAELRATYLGEFDIDLYGHAQLSDLLRSQPEIVQRFFGKDTADRFCVGRIQDEVGSPNKGVEPQAAQIAEAVLRGPLQALGLESALEEAEELVESHPTDAARLYAKIADQVSNNGWPAHALMLKRRAGEALSAASDYTEAGRLVAELFWTYLDLGAQAESQLLMHELKQISEATPDDQVVALWAQAAAEAYGAVCDPFDQLGSFAAVVDNLAPGSDTEVESLVLLSELALTSGQIELIVDRTSRISEAAQTAPPLSDCPSMGLRLRLCLADATDDWTELRSDVEKRSLSHWDMALVLGRYGRYLAWHNSPDRARDRFGQAIERAVLLAANDDAIEWLHATRYLDFRYGPIPEEVNEAYRRSQALRAAGSAARVFRHLTSPREKVLRCLHDEKYPAAAEAARRFLRECVVAGHWGSELEAHALLGDVFASTGEHKLATRHYVRAGEHKKLEALLRDGPYVDLRQELSRPGPWERGAVYRAVVAEADRVPNDHVNEIVSSAVTDAQAVTDGQVRQGQFAPQVWASAIAVIGALVERASKELAGDVLKLLSPLAERATGRSLHTDDDHIKALAGIVRGHGPHRDAALRAISQAFESDGPFAVSALKNAGNLMASVDDAVPILEALATKGNSHARLMLAARGIRSQEVLQEAEIVFDQVMNRPKPDGRTVTFGTGLDRDSYFLSVLELEKRDTAADRLMQIAEDARESDVNRVQALQAIANLGQDLSPETRRDLYMRAMRFAKGEATNSSLSPDLRREPHPLSRFQIHLSPGPLEPYGLEAAGSLARSETDTDAIVELALTLIASSDKEATIHLLVTLLSWYGGDRLIESQAVLASQPNASLRALAAVLWVRDVNRSSDLGYRLATDPNMLVRLSLAREIASSTLFPSDDQVIGILATDDHYSVREALQDTNYGG